MGGGARPEFWENISGEVTGESVIFSLKGRYLYHKLTKANAVVPGPKGKLQGQQSLL